MPLDRGQTKSSNYNHQLRLLSSDFFVFGKIVVIKNDKNVIEILCFFQTGYLNIELVQYCNHLNAGYLNVRFSMGVWYSNGKVT